MNGGGQMSIKKKMPTRVKGPPKAQNSLPKAKRPTDQRTREPRNVNKITDNFLREILSLQFAQEETSKVLKASVNKHRHAFDTFLKPFKRVKEGTSLNVIIPIEKAEELGRLTHELSSSAGSLALSHRGLFLVLVSKWDAYFGSLLRWVYRVRPEIVDSSSRTISFAELKQINSIDMARNKIVEDEISVVLREGHGEQFEYLERKLSVTLKKLDIWPKFIELTQRRNLIAHADGKISDQYLKVCGDNKVELDGNHQIGSDLEIPPEYLSDSCNYLAELGFKLSQVLWRKLQPSESSEADSHLLDTTYEMVKAGQYELAIKLLTFSLAPPMKFKEARDRYVCIVNLALAYKWTNNEKKSAEIIGAEEWSAVPLDLRLALAVLKDDFEQAVSLMKQIGTSGEVTKMNYQDWPLFKKFRSTKRFVKTYRDIFKTEFEVREVLSETGSNLLLSPEFKALPKTKTTEDKQPKSSPAAS
jgi:hypothetical protein